RIATKNTKTAKMRPLWSLLCFLWLNSSYGTLKMNMDLLLLIALLLYLAGAFQAIIIFATKQTSTARALFWTTAAGFALHTASLIVGWKDLGHFPIVNIKEVSSFVAWAIVAYYLVISRRFHARALAAFILPVVFLFALIGLIIPEVSGPLPV